MVLFLLPSLVGGFRHPLGAAASEAPRCLGDVLSRVTVVGTPCSHVPLQSPSAHTWLVGVSSAAIPRLVVEEEGATEGHQAPAQAGGQRGGRSHGEQLSPAGPSSARISQEGINEVTGQANAQGHVAIGSLGTELLSWKGDLGKENSHLGT